jgi:hypothetical protein
MIAFTRTRLAWMLAAAATTAALAVVSTRAVACPFCSAVSLSFSEEINNSQIAAIVKLTEAPPPSDDPAGSLDVAKAKFEIVKVLKGADQ